jgi:hypothetical protein
MVSGGLSGLLELKEISCKAVAAHYVMLGLVPASTTFLSVAKTWMAGTSPAMTA